MTTGLNNLFKKIRDGEDAYNRAAQMFGGPDQAQPEEPSIWEKLFHPFDPKVRAWNQRQLAPLASDTVTGQPSGVPDLLGGMGRGFEALGQDIKSKYEALKGSTALSDLAAPVIRKAAESPAGQWFTTDKEIPNPKILPDEVGRFLWEHMGKPGGGYQESPDTVTTSPAELLGYLTEPLMAVPPIAPELGGISASLKAASATARAKAPQIAKEAGQVGRELATSEAGFARLGKEIPKELAATPEYAVKQEPFAPEAGMQSGMFGQQKEIRPQGKGQVTQITMNDQAKLAEYELSQKQAELEGLRDTLANDPAAKLTDLIPRGKKSGEVDNIGVKKLTSLTGKTDWKSAFEDAAHNKVVRWEDALDELASERGFTDAESLKEAIEKAAGMKAQAKSLEHDIAISQESIGTGLEAKVGVPPLKPPAVEAAKLKEGVPGATAPPIKPPEPPKVATGMAEQPPSITPGPMAENVIGLRAIEPGLVRSEVVGNWTKDLLNKPLHKLDEGGFVKANEYANPAMRERARVMTSVVSNANVLGTKAEHLVNSVFKLDKNGRIEALAGIDSSVKGAPTIQDVAARLPLYDNVLTAEQKAALTKLNELVSPYRQLLSEVGVEVAGRPDVVEGGFYLPRGRAGIEGTDNPIKVGGGLGRGMRKGFERPSTFDSQAQGIDAGYRYPSIGEALTSYAKDAGTRATDAHMVNYFKTLTDETGKLLGETPKMRMLRENPELAQTVEKVKADLDRLKHSISSLTNRQLDVIDLWQHDPEYTDINELLNGLATMRGGKAKSPMTRPELLDELDRTIAELEAIKPEYQRALRKAEVTPRDQGQIGMPGLQGITYADEIANAANKILRRQGETKGALSTAVNAANAFNNLYRGIRATLDDSALGIQGLIGLGAAPNAYRKALKVNLEAWGNNGDKILGHFLTDFDAKVAQTGRLTTADWSKAGIHLGGATSEFALGQPGTGIGQKISNLPGVRHANRAFGYFGDALRLEWADAELANQLSRHSLDELKASGELEKIATGANLMTGWSPNKAFGSVGDLVLFAPKFLQSQFETLAKVGQGLKPGAGADARMVRNSFLKFIGLASTLTFLGNYVQGQETDTRLFVDGERNPRFMRIKYGDNWYSLFGTWDSLAGMFVNVGMGKPLQALRNKGSGLTTVAFDLISGRDYDYQPTRDTPAHFAQWVLGQMIPMSAGQMPTGVKQAVKGAQAGDTGAAIAGGVNVASQIVGAKSTELTPPKTFSAPKIGTLTPKKTNPLEPTKKKPLIPVK